MKFIKKHKHLRSLQPANSNNKTNSAEQQRRLEGLVKEVEKLYLYIEILERKINE